MKKLIVAVMLIGMLTSLNARCKVNVTGTQSALRAQICLMDERNEIETMKMKYLKEQNDILKETRDAVKSIANKLERRF